MVGLNDAKTDAPSSIRNRTSRLNRSSDTMKSMKEDGYESSGQADQKRPVNNNVHELDDQVNHSTPHQDHPSMNHAVVDRLLEDNSSNNPALADPFEMMINQTQPLTHRTARQHQSHPKPPHHLIPIAHRRTTNQPKTEDTSPRQWTNNIEDSITGILKRLDQLAASRENQTGNFMVELSIKY